MARINNLWEEFSSWQNFSDAYAGVRKNGRFKESALEFHDNQEENLITLHEEVLHGTYQTSGFTTFPVFEPKERIIEAPAYRDRIVHHAIHNIAAPIFETKFIKDSFACRKGKGVHACIAATQYHLRRELRNNNFNNIYILQMDIRGYFHFVNHDILFRELERHIKDYRFLDVWHKVICSGGENGVGQPIGALTSQDGANIYLNPLDHYIKDTLGIKGYARYMDDFIIIGSNKQALHELAKHIEEWLFKELELELSKKKLFSYKQGVDFAGYRTWPTHILARKKNIKNAKRKVKAHIKAGRHQKAYEVLASFYGYIKHADNRLVYFEWIYDLMKTELNISNKLSIKLAGELYVGNRYLQAA